MHSLVASLLAQLSAKPREQDALYDELDEMIGRLQQQQEKLARRLPSEAQGAKKRRLKIALDVVRLQLNKAIRLRAGLPRR